MNEKMQWLRNKMSSMELQGMIITNPLNIKYLTNIDADGILVITRKENLFITDALNKDYVHSILTLFDEIIVYDKNDLTKDEYENLFLFCENIGFEENHLTYAKYKEYIHKFKIHNFVETENMIEKQRMIKDNEEIKNLTIACEITDECFSYLLEYIKPGMTEKQIAKEIEEFFNLKAEGLAFDTIVASGENTSKPHAIPSDRKIQTEDIITIDMGCKYKGYCSDMTRTFFVGKVPEYVKNVYELVLKNEKQTLNDIKDGANTKIISTMVENDFKLNNHTLIHCLGHGVGLEVHEVPYVSYKVDTKLRENMVLAIEPGIYIPGKFGVRIEDTVLVTKFGCISLTKSNKDYIIL